VDKREPIFNVPAAIVVVLIILISIHYGLDLLDETDRNWWVVALALIPARYTSSTPFAGDPVAEVTSLVTHMLLHIDTTHLLVNGLSLLAFGGAVAQRIGNWRFIVLLLVTGIAGALTYIGFNWGRTTIVIGASGAVSGMMAGSFRFFFSALGTVGLQGFRDNPRAVPLLSIADTFRNRQCLIAMVAWGLINFLMGLGGSLITGGAGIAWEAHLGGFLAGLLLFGFFDPPYDPAEDIGAPVEAQQDDHA
jgi:membrane associated rhomboid family serine protease